MTAAGGGDTIVVIPAYNEEASLPAVLAQLAEVTPEFAIVVVDDGSLDRTAAVCRSAGVPCVRLPFNLGIGGALRAGYRYAADHGYKQAVQFDADGQHRADQIGVLLAGLAEGADLVVGSRFAAGDYSVGRSRGVAMAILRFGVRMLTGQRFSDTSSGFRAVRHPLLEVFATEYPVEYMDSVETLVSACRAGFRVVEVPTVMEERTGGVPSQRRFRLVYHFARLLVVLMGSPRRKAPEGQ